MQLPWSVVRRLYVTLIALALVVAGRRIPVPGLNHDAWASLSPETLGYPATITIFSAGIRAYMSAAVVVLLLSGLIPALRRLRDGEPDQTRAFDGLILAGTAAIAFVQSFGFLEIASRSSHTGSLSAAAQPLLVVTVIVGGALALAGLAILITRHGIGNGVALIFAATLLLDFPHALRVMARDIVQREGSVPGYLLTAVVIVAMVAICVAVLRGHREIVLERVPGAVYPAKGPVSPAPSVRPVLRLPFNTVGNLPIAVAATVMGVPMSLSAMGVRIHPLWMPGSLSPLRLAVELAVIVLATYVLTAWNFGNRSAGDILERFGYRPAGCESPAEAGRIMDAALGRLVLPFAFFLFLLSVLPFLLMNILGVKFAMARLAGVSTLVLAAVALDTRRQVRALVAIAPDREDDGVPYEDVEENPEEEAEDDGAEDADELLDEEPRWTVVAVFDTELEAELLVAEFSRASIEAVVLANRWMSAIGSLSLWGPCRPAYAALAPHRRLAEGAVKVYVRETDAERARSLIPTAS